MQSQALIGPRLGSCSCSRQGLQEMGGKHGCLSRTPPLFCMAGSPQSHNDAEQLQNCKHTTALSNGLKHREHAPRDPGQPVITACCPMPSATPTCSPSPTHYVWSFQSMLCVTARHADRICKFTASIPTCQECQTKKTSSMMHRQPRVQLSITPEPPPFKLHCSGIPPWSWR